MGFKAKEILEKIQKSFNLEIENNLNFNSEERELFNYLKRDLFDNFLEINPFLSNENPNLYSYAEEFIEKINDGEFSPFYDYPLCDSLKGIYQDFSVLCGEIGNELGYQENVDLSNLDGLQETLAGLVVSRILEQYKDCVDEIQPKYEKAYGFFQDLAKWENGEDVDMDMPDWSICYPNFEFQRNENNLIDLNSIKLTEDSKERFFNFLNDNRFFAFEYSYLSELFKEDELKESLMYKSHKENNSAKIRRM